MAAQNDCGISPPRVVGVIVNPCRVADDGSIIPFSNVSVFPNPAKDKLVVQFEGAEHEQYDIRMLDMTGREVVSFKRESVSGINNEIIDLSGFAKGLYILDVNRVEGHQKIKVVIE